MRSSTENGVKNISNTGCPVEVKGETIPNPRYVILAFRMNVPNQKMRRKRIINKTVSQSTSHQEPSGRQAKENHTRFCGAFSISEGHRGTGEKSKRSGFQGLRIIQRLVHTQMTPGPDFMRDAKMACRWNSVL